MSYETRSRKRQCVSSDDTMGTTSGRRSSTECSPSRSKGKRKHRHLDLTSSSSEESSSGSHVSYTLFKFGVDIEKHEVSVPADLVEGLPALVSGSRLKKYIPSSYSHGNIYFSHERRLAFYCFENQEACSSSGRYSTKLRDRLIDRKSSGYVLLPDAGTLRAAEVFDGGKVYSRWGIQVDDVADKLHISCDLIQQPWQPYTPPNEIDRTAALVDHLEDFIRQNNLQLTLKPPPHSSNDFFIFSGGGDVSVMSNEGCVVIGGTVTDDDIVTPLKEGDIATTANIENKVPTNPQQYINCEKQLFANMHLSATKAMAPKLLDGTIPPDKVERLIAYGTILKPGCNNVALYKLVAPCNGATYVQIDFSVQTLFWHPIFDRVLLYTFNKLS